MQVLRCQVAASGLVTPSPLNAWKQEMWPQICRMYWWRDATSASLMCMRLQVTVTTEGPTAGLKGARQQDLFRLRERVEAKLGRPVSLSGEGDVRGRAEPPAAAKMGANRKLSWSFAQVMELLVLDLLQR